MLKDIFNMKRVVNSVILNFALLVSIQLLIVLELAEICVKHAMKKIIALPVNKDMK